MGTYARTTGCGYRAPAEARPRNARRAGREAPRSLRRLQELEQPGQRLAPVAEAVLFLRRELGRGFAERGEPEEGIVAKAAGSARRGCDLAVPFGLGHERTGVRGAAHEDKNAYVVRLSVALAFQFPKQLFVVARIRPRLARIARRMHARRAAQRVDADAGIVRERRQPGREARVPRLGERVLEKRVVRLLGFREANLGLRDHARAEALEQRLDLGFLARIPGSKD